MNERWIDMDLERALLNSYYEELEEYRPPSIDDSDDEFLEEVRMKREEYRNELMSNGMYQLFKNDEEEN